MTTPLAPGRLHLSKHHGLGNDFLVWLTDDDTASRFDLPALARRLCDRHRGVGADGLLVGTPDLVANGPAADIVMVLHNADGSRAEMSGNGIRCFVQAVARRDDVQAGELRVRTDAGLRVVSFGPDADDPSSFYARVDMGPAGPGPEPDTGVPEPSAGPEATPQRQAVADLGNPHLVLLVDDPAKVDVAEVGPRWEARYRAGMNVHFVAPSPGGDALTVHTWERGAGPTQACGTGASAAAHVAHQWGLVGDDLVVHMPGGDVRVALGETVTLAGPSVWIGDLDVVVPSGTTA
jgi:diaminopimelate epimerase